MTVLTGSEGSWRKKDILIASTDNSEWLYRGHQGVFPLADTQLCIVHQSVTPSGMWYGKTKKEFAADMKEIYHAATLQAAEQAL
ncbi:MAG: hypothetical protein IPI37_07235 [Bacteroidales bacterium]|nr:hypothetical protein [Bacteroidales bacterium]